MFTRTGSCRTELEIAGTPQKKCIGTAQPSFLEKEQQKIQGLKKNPRRNCVVILRSSCLWQETLSNYRLLRELGSCGRHVSLQENPALDDAALKVPSVQLALEKANSTVGLDCQLGTTAADKVELAEVGPRPWSAKMSRGMCTVLCPRMRSRKVVLCETKHLPNQPRPHKGARSTFKCRYCELEMTGY